ncbi:MAG: MerR family transcriptional regulator [Chitinophagales bacterium]|jgi:DNA-binding transcriptional MerR regulator|nr:MerR family transcriptional regulator [Chitinophagales bacterium]
MAIYSIKDIELLSGIKAHTLRIWEQRYDIFRPKRTQTNIRLYDDEDLRLILNVSILLQNGYRIGRIARLEQREICSHIAKLLLHDNETNTQILGLITAMLNLDEVNFENIVEQNIQKIGIEKTMFTMVYPFLERIGIMWALGSINPAQEHFISNLVRQKIIAAIDNLKEYVCANTPKYLLYLPEGEWHEISLLLLCYMIKSRNNKVVYLGANVPTSAMISVAQALQPQFIISILTTEMAIEQIAKHTQQVCENFPFAQHLFIGKQAHKLSVLPPNGTHIKSIQEILSLVEQQQHVQI